MWAASTQAVFPQRPALRAGASINSTAFILHTLVDAPPPSPLANYADFNIVPLASLILTPNQQAGFASITEPEPGDALCKWAGLARRLVRLLGPLAGPRDWPHFGRSATQAGLLHPNAEGGHLHTHFVFPT